MRPRRLGAVRGRSTRLVNEQRQFRNGVVQHRCSPSCASTPKLTRYDEPRRARGARRGASHNNAGGTATIGRVDARGRRRLRGAGDSGSGEAPQRRRRDREYARCTGLDLETILWRATAVRTEQLVLGAARV